ncbi:MAG: GxxExxY protein [Kiritimatiellae bacterium]|nr:GxxExxY protein [Kiritimatiellia bacterium]
MITENEISGDVVDVAVKLHQRLGPGLLESVYEMILAAELIRRGHKVERQVPVSFEYDGMKFDDAFRADLIVDDQVIVELKATEQKNRVFARQLKTYLVLMEKPLGLLLNFGQARMSDGIERVVNGYEQ